jgi:phospholipid/cholesterol/gamma-HCH transport system substrate-binding protein
MAGSFKNVLIGLFVLIGISIIVFMLLFLHPSVGDNAKTLLVRFSNIDKVNVGTRVTYAGHPVGEVVSIQEIPDARVARTPHDGQVYVYELTLKVDSGVNVFNTDTLTLRTSGLLGERNIDITPGVLKPGEPFYTINDQILYSLPAGSVEESLKNFGNLNKRFSIVLKDVHLALETLRKEMVIENIGITAKNAAEISTAFNQTEKIDKFVNNLLRTSENIAKLSVSANKSWESVDQTINEFHAASINLRSSSDNVLVATEDAKKIVQNTLEGNGSIGRLLMKDDLYLRLKSILSKGDTIFGDVKQYGILFQTDKKWQRINARRQQLLQRLSKPEIFAQYFQNEMDQISTSLSSVSMLLNDTECYPRSLMTNPDFTFRFADLMRRVGIMEESLNMYNEQIVDLGKE